MTADDPGVSRAESCVIACADVALSVRFRPPPSTTPSAIDAAAVVCA